METETLSPNAFRCREVHRVFDQLIEVLGDPERFEPVKYGRWKSVTPGVDVQIETNYVYGEGTVRFYVNNGNDPFKVIKIRGLPGEWPTLRSYIRWEEWRTAPGTIIKVGDLFPATH